uniref:DUF952 domain-containing protein n=1 Tax=Picea sitchensis TaxID=3332 RepID=B8LM79_PICSI|nr:unknown [Picea sitchensis]
MGEEKEQETPAVLIYRVSTEAEWNELQQTGSTLGGDLDKQTGCIHLSTDSQVKGVLEIFFSGRRDLYLLKLEAAKLGEGLIYESADGLNFFPHFYGPSGSFTPLTVDPIIEVSKLELVDGNFVLPF